MADEVKLGYRYKDPVSGFTGTAVSVHTFLWGCRRITLEGADEKGEPKAFTFDEPQLVSLGGKPTVKLPEDTPNSPPRRTGGPRGAEQGGKNDRS